jgi:hypothetical protein
MAGEGEARPARRRRRLRPARQTPRAVRRAWLILALMIVIYLAVMLTIYFVEPGLR